MVLGALLGVGFGDWFGEQMVGLYADYFRFPDLVARVDPQTAIAAVLVSAIAGVVGTLTSVRSVLKLAPAEAMAPPAPARYRRGFLEGPLFGRLVGPSTRMILREVQRRRGTDRAPGLRDREHELQVRDIEDRPRATYARHA